MLREKLNVDGRVGRESKIRKRGCSSSSSSSLARKYRLKKAILGGKRTGSSTPVPTWKMGSKSPPPPVLQNAKPMKYPPGKDLSVSARKLAATLWEINEVASSPREEENWEGRNEFELRSRERIMKRMDRSRAGDHRRRDSAIAELEGLESILNSNILEVETQSHGRTPSSYVVDVKTRLKDVSNGLTASKELLKVLNHIWFQEENRSLSISLVSALRFELDRARKQVDQLIQEQQPNQYEIGYLLKQFAEEKAAWKSKVRDRIRNAISSIAGEIEIEKKLRKQTERLNKKLGGELADTRASLSKALKELQSEKRAREILEQVCDELARGIGEDKAEVEKMKRESAKVKEEIEREREMLELADVLREERVQMKLSEAKYEFEEKNAAVNKLKSELEAYMRNKAGKGMCDDSPNFDRIKELEEYLMETLGASYQNEEKKQNEEEVVNEEEHEGDDSADSDLHSIELNMDNNSRSYNWSYAGGGATQSESKRSSVDEKNKGRRLISEKIQRNNICLERKTADGIEWDFGRKSQESSDGFDRGRLLKLASQALRKDYEDEIERYEMVRELRDHILSGTSISSSHVFESPIRRLDQSLPIQDPATVVSESLMLLEGLGLKPQSGAQRI